MDGYFQISLARMLCIVRNIRRLNSKAWNARTNNWWLIHEYFGVGSTKSYEWCELLGIDPDGFTA